MKRFEVLNIITYWRRSAQSNEKVGWLLRDSEDQKDYVYTYDEAWQLIHEFGAVNAEAFIKKTESREIQELVPLAPQPSFLDTSWQNKYEEAEELIYSPSCYENIQRLICNDEKWKIKNNRDQWLRTQKEVTSLWYIHPNIMNCIDIAHKIQKSDRIRFYVGASIWQEVGLGKVYATDCKVDRDDNLEDLFVPSMTKMGIDASYIDSPYIFELLKIIKGFKGDIEILFEVEEGLFQKKKVEASIDLVLAIGAEVPAEDRLIENVHYIGHEPCQSPDRYKSVLHAPITQALKEIERHFVLKGRMLCGVCGEKVAHSIGGSCFAPVQVVVCYSCGSQGAEPYGILVAHVARLMSRIPDYNLSPKLLHVKQATLSITGISEETFIEDVEKQLHEIMARKG